MKVNLIHISDLHLKESSRISQSRVNGIRSFIHDSIAENIQVILVISGDIANSGKASEYSNFLDFILELRKGFDETKIDIVMVPGNHDLDFSLLSEEEQEDRNKKIDEMIIKKTHNKYNELINPNLQKEFFNLFERIVSSEAIVKGLLYRKTISIEDISIEIDMLNTSLFSRKTEEAGKLYYPEEIIKQHYTDNNNLKICVLHHPFEWMNRNLNIDFPDIITSNYSLVLFGHEHKEKLELVHDLLLDRKCHILSGGEFNNLTDRNQSEFKFISINTQENKISCESYYWNTKIYSEDKEKHIEFKVPQKFCRHHHVLRAEFVDFLNEIDIEVIHKTENRLSLNELFIHNDIIEDNKDGKTNISQEIDIMSIPHVILNGKKHYGKTTLLKHYYKVLFKKKYVPIFLHGINMKRINSVRDLNKEIRGAYKYIYGTEDDYFDIPRDYRAILIDDVEHIQIYYKNKKQIFEYIQNDFEISIITKGTETELSEKFRLDFDSYVFGGWKNYTLIEVKSLTLEKILQNWYGRFDIPETDRINTINTTESLLKTINKEGLVNFIHKYIYISIQMIDGNSVKSDLGKKTLPYYYEFLLNRKLSRLKFEGDEIKLIDSFLAELSFAMYKKNKERIELTEFSDLYRDYKIRFGISDYSATKLNSSTTVLEELIESRILNKKNDTIFYIERYLYFFTLTKYLSKNYNNKKNGLVVKNILRKSIKHFRKDRNNNLINFYIYHEENLEDIIDMIVNKAKSIFRFSRRFDYEYQKFALNLNENLIGPYQQEEQSARERRLKQAKREDERLSEMNYSIAGIEKTGDEVSGDIEEAFDMIELLSNILKVHWWKLDDQKYKLPIVNQAISLMEKCTFKIHKLLHDKEDRFMKELKPIVTEIMMEKKQPQETKEEIEDFVDHSLKETYSIFNIFFNASILITAFKSLSFYRLDTTIKLYLKQQKSNSEVYSVYFDVLAYGKIDKSKIKSLFIKYRENSMVRKSIELLFIVYLSQFQPTKEFVNNYKDLVSEKIICSSKKLLR